MATAVRETPVPGDVPRMAVPVWEERFGVVAGITVRGEGDPGFDLGLWGAGPSGEAMARWRAFRRADPRFPAHRMAHQCHGARVLFHGGADEGWLIADGADGHVTATPGVLLTVTVADCIPIYLVDPVARAVALLHSGWRGTAARILEQGLEVMAERVPGFSVDNLVMHGGVGICGDC